VGFLIIIPAGFLLSLAWVLWSVRPQRRPDANDTMQWHRRSMAALHPGRDGGQDGVAGGAAATGAVRSGTVASGAVASGAVGSGAVGSETVTEGAVATGAGESV
jgi:hypothetical protein